MMDNTQNAIRMIQENREALVRLMQSSDGQRLIQMLHRQSGGNALKQAAGAAAAGNTAEITQMIQQLMQDPEGMQLVERITRSAQAK